MLAIWASPTNNIKDYWSQISITSLKDCKNYQNLTQKHKVSKCSQSECIPHLLEHKDVTFQSLAADLTGRWSISILAKKTHPIRFISMTGHSGCYLLSKFMDVLALDFWKRTSLDARIAGLPLHLTGRRQAVCRCKWIWEAVKWKGLKDYTSLLLGNSPAQCQNSRPSPCTCRSCTLN